LKTNKYASSIIGAALFGATLFLFRLPISHLLDTIIVGPVFSYFERGIVTDAMLLILLPIISIWISKTQRRKFLFKLTLFGLIFYSLQRINGYWSFTFMKLFSQLAYWDFFALLMALLLPLSYLLQIESADSEIVDNNVGFIEDNAVTKLEDDYFNRKITAEEIAVNIQLTQNRKSFAIGILGEYGSGKTSFLNLINLKLNPDEVLKINFDPWSVGNPENIRREFFDLLAREVAEYDSKISSLVYSYGRKLASFDSRSLSWFNWLSFFRNRNSAQSSGEYEQINKMLRGLRRKIVITIDDLDRLYPSEIIEVLKLIRNTADFSNVCYLVGYDKAYIQEAIKAISSVGGQNYLDKIFQLEIPLPKYEDDVLLNTLQENLKKIISSNHYTVFENVMSPNNFRSRYEKTYSCILRQERDVVRFVNSFKITYKLIGDEVDFECLLLIELIKFRFPIIYEMLYAQRDLFLCENSVMSTHEQHLVPLITKSDDSKKTDQVSFFKTYIEKFEWLSFEEVSILNVLFLNLFNGSSYHHPKAKNSISYPLYFEIYFRNRLSKKELSDKEFKVAMREAINMPKYMAYCASHGLHKQLMIRLMQEDISKDRQHFEKVIRWIFSFGRTFVEKEGMFRFDYGALINKINDLGNHITDKLYKKDTVAYKNFISHLFNIATAPYIFENELIFNLKEKSNDFIISKSELTLHQLSYFRNMAESGHGLSEETLWLFWGAREYDYTSEGSLIWRFEPLLVEKMKDYLIDKDPKEFLKFSIQQNMRDRSLVIIIKEVIEMFTDPIEYRKLIENSQALSDNIRTEYLKLFDKLAEKDFNQYMEFELKTELAKR
jgi:energy-coupling factor transporter ATP-binding protein EcfA2